MTPPLGPNFGKNWNVDYFEIFAPPLILTRLSRWAVINFFSGNILYTLFKVIFHWRSYIIKGRPPSKVVFRLGSSSVKGHLSSKVVSRQRSSSVKGRLPSKVVFRQRLSSVKGRLPSKVVFRQRLSSFKGSLISKVVFRQAVPDVWRMMRPLS